METNANGPELVLQLSPVQAVEDGPPHSPVRGREALTRGCSCWVTRRSGTKRRLYGQRPGKASLWSGKLDSWREKTATEDERPQTALDQVLPTNPAPTPNLAETERGATVWVTGSVVKTGKILPWRKF